MQIWERFKSDDDQKQSSDVVLIIAPGAAPNSPENKNAVTLVSFLRTCKVQPPKIGTIVPHPSDVVVRSRARGAFNAPSEDTVVFTTQKKVVMTRKIVVDSRDTFFNKWQTPLIQFAQLRRCSRETYDKIFKDTPVATLEDISADDNKMSAEEEALGDDVRIPFPHEHERTLGQKIIATFEPEVLFVMDVGSGEFLKAALLAKIFAVGICKNDAHKTFVMDTLREWVKTMKLVNMNADAPKKPDDIIAYEKMISRLPPTAPGVRPPAPPAPALPAPGGAPLLPTAALPSNLKHFSSPNQKQANLFSFGTAAL
jgi:hypothetical protein